MQNLFTKKLTVILILVSFLSLEGCEAFRKKFTRKKKTVEVEEEMVLVPQEYPELVYDSSTLYRKHYNFWRAWQSELLGSLRKGQSYKKQIQCFDEVLENLGEMKNLLLEQKRPELEAYISDIAKIKERLVKAKLRDMILPQLRTKLTSIDKKIRINFTYNKVKDLIKD